MLQPSAAKIGFEFSAHERGYSSALLVQMREEHTVVAL